MLPVRFVAQKSTENNFLTLENEVTPAGDKNHKSSQNPQIFQSEKKKTKKKSLLIKFCASLFPFGST